MHSVRMKDESHKLLLARSILIAALGLFSSFIIHPTSFLHADSIFVGTLERKNAIIKELRGESLFYDYSGRTSEVPAARVTRLIVDNEPPLNIAEESFATEKWDAAVDGYQKTIRTTSKPWIKDWAAMRLIAAANKSGRFDAAAFAYILALLKNPTTASNMKPVMPESKSTFLDSAVADVNTTLGDPRLTAVQRRALLGFLIELQQVRNDLAGEDAAYEQLIKLPGADMNDPNAKRVLARRRLTAAAKALDSKNYQQAITEIDSNKALFIEPKQQADALYLLAQAREGAAGTDSTSLKDAALAYMRVVALAKTQPDAPHVVDSLLKTAALLEQLGQKPTAIQLYDQIISQYPDDPAVNKARSKLATLKQN
ncbi:MAG TPA: tetratricopeptide repeat protein [Tepidisphaeraceae bacterium]|nr:tetratricopeptide repeat protein [Tepidisphaeraceae bacterium]